MREVGRGIMGSGIRIQGLGRLLGRREIRERGTRLWNGLWFSCSRVLSHGVGVLGV